MLSSTLVILDLNKNFNLQEQNVKFISLNKGLINLKNSEQIFIDDYRSEKKVFYKKFLLKLLNIISKNKKSSIPFIELEINNLRNDRYGFIDRIINLLVIKKIIKKNKFKKIKIISDDKKTLNIFNGLSIKIQKVDLTKNIEINNFFKLKLLKFYFKTLFVVCFLRFVKKNFISKKNSEFFLEINPNKFNYYNKKKNNKFMLNFLLTDETHLNHSFFKICKIILSQKKNKNLINIESFISIKYLFCLMFKILFQKKLTYFDEINFKIDNLNFVLELKEFYLNSYLNRLKLKIYDNAIHKFLNKLDVKKFNFYLFEYSFGFYLINKIKNFSKQIKIIGYQHGVFSRNLFWFDILRLIKDKNRYFPDKIIASNKYSKEDYFHKIERNIIEISPNKNIEYSNLVNKIKISQKSKNIIVLAGTHDVSDLYYFFKNIEKFKKKKIFFKLHPKNKYNIIETSNIKIIDKFINLDFCMIVISQTSSLVYDFLKMKKNFSVVDIDYKTNLLNNKIFQKTKILSRKKINAK
jgi:hypothetical protein